MPGYDSEALHNSPEGTRDSLESLEARFHRAYGREMTPEERKYFGLVERFARFEPEGRSEPAKIREPKNEYEASTTPVEDFDGPDSGGSKAA
jgi:hypothetical protein